MRCWWIVLFFCVLCRSGCLRACNDQELILHNDTNFNATIEYGRPDYGFRGGHKVIKETESIVAHTTRVIMPMVQRDCIKMRVSVGEKTHICAIPKERFVVFLSNTKNYECPKK